ncbi:MAG: GNAT family N-acetyltransferase [Myxococcota bacterium]
MRTQRLEIRPPRESDRARFVALFTNDTFMEFSDGVMTAEAASERFDRMLHVANEVAFGKQPIIERSSGTLVGYCGVDGFDFEGRRRLEWGYRLVAEARGQGYATEASAALLDLAEPAVRAEILAIIHPPNAASIRTITKLGFEFWKEAPVSGETRNLYRYTVPDSG